VPVELPLPALFRKARWKVKIQEKESKEPPHVSILRGTDKWRINLRTGEFMDRLPDSSGVPGELLKIIRSHWKWLCDRWDGKYPDNPVVSEADEEQGNDDNPSDTH
jgi:hypothetical protein